MHVSYLPKVKIEDTRVKGSKQCKPHNTFDCSNAPEKTENDTKHLPQPVDNVKKLVFVRPGRLGRESFTDGAGDGGALTARASALRGGHRVGVGKIQEINGLDTTSR